MRIKQDTGDIPGQMNLNELLKLGKPKKDKLLKVGDRIGRVVLGECYTATITAVEGLPDWPFYRTTRGCYSYEEGLRSIEELEKEAEEARLKYITIEPKGLTERITVQYPPRECDGRVLTAQLGIYDGSWLFWRYNLTYSFLEPFEDPKKLKKEYEKHKKRMLEEDGHRGYALLDHELPIERLYWSGSRKAYASAEYTIHNP